MSDYNSKLPVRNQGIYNAIDNEDASNVAIVAHERSATPGQDTQTQRPTAIVSTDGDNATALDVALRDSQGNALTEQNPLPVYIAENPGVEVLNYSEAVDVAKDATSNHDYTVTAATTLKSISVDGSASGKARFEIRVETAPASGTFNTVAVLFNSTASANITIDLERLEVAAGVILRIAKTNLDNKAQSIYSTIQGIEVA